MGSRGNAGIKKTVDTAARFLGKPKIGKEKSRNKRERERAEGM